MQLDRRGNDVDKGQSANRISRFGNAGSPASVVSTAITGDEQPYRSDAARRHQGTSATVAACSYRIRGR